MTLDDLICQYDGHHLTIERRDGYDGISWDLLMAAKNEHMGPETVAVEVYPADEDVVNERHRRHLWRVPDTVRVPNLRQDRRWFCDL